MSLTWIAFIAFFIIVGFAAGAFVLAANSKKTIYETPFIVLGCILVGVALASMVLGFFSLNDNIRDTQERCMQNNGYIYINKCVDRIPLELQRM